MNTSDFECFTMGFFTYGAQPSGLRGRKEMARPRGNSRVVTGIEEHSQSGDMNSRSGVMVAGYDRVFLSEGRSCLERSLQGQRAGNPAP